MSRMIVAKKTRIKRKRERLSAAHVGASASVDLDGFAFFDEKRNVDGFAGFEFCGLGHVAGGISADALSRFDHFYADGRRHLEMNWFAFSVEHLDGAIFLHIILSV